MGLRPMPRQKLEVSGLPSFYRFAINIERIVFAAITTEKPLDERLFIYRKCKNLRFLPESEAEPQRSPSFSSACAPSSSAPITPELTPSAGGTI